MVIFDVGGVLVHEAELKLEMKIYYRLFAFLKYLEPSVDHKREHTMNLRSGKDLLALIHAEIDNPSHDNFFTNQQERNAIKDGAAHLLIPEVEAAHTYLQEEALTFVRECKANNIRILALSNWQPDAFKLVKKKFAALFNLFDNTDIFLPIDMGFMKPEPAPYIHVITTADLDPTQTFFIDDSQRNIDAAVACGLQGILHHNWQTTRKILTKKGFTFNNRRTS